MDTNAVENMNIMNNVTQSVEVVKCWKCGVYADKCVRMVRTQHPLCIACEERRLGQHRTYHRGPGEATALELTTELIARMKYEMDWGYSDEQRRDGHMWLVGSHRDYGHDTCIWDHVVKPLMVNFPKVEEGRLMAERLDIKLAIRNRHRVRRHEEMLARKAEQYRACLEIHVQPLAKRLAFEFLTREVVGRHHVQPMIIADIERHSLFQEACEGITASFNEDARQHYKGLGFANKEVALDDCTHAFHKMYLSEHLSWLQRRDASDLVGAIHVVESCISNIERENKELQRLIRWEFRGSMVARRLGLKAVFATLST